MAKCKIHRHHDSLDKKVENKTEIYKPFLGKVLNMLAFSAVSARLALLRFLHKPSNLENPFVVCEQKKRNIIT